MSEGPVVLIGVVGIAGSGKTLVSKYLVQSRGFTRHRFADPIKLMLKVGLGLTDEQVDGDAKMMPIEGLRSVTPRQMMQTLGTDWGRRMISPELWVEAMRRLLQQERGPVVVDDVRYPNEADLIRAMGGVLWRVYRPGLSTMDHSSERGIKRINEDSLITNATSIPALQDSIEALLNQPIQLPRAAG